MMFPKSADQLKVGLSGLGLRRALLQVPPILFLGPVGKLRHLILLAMAESREQVETHKAS